MLKAQGIDLPKLHDMYDTLCANGLGQMRLGHWLALSALAYPQPLAVLLNAPNRAIGCHEVMEMYGAL